MNKRIRRLAATAAVLLTIAAAVLLGTAESTSNWVYRTVHAEDAIDTHYNDQLQDDGDIDNNLNFGPDTYAMALKAVENGEAESVLDFFIHREADGTLSGYLIHIIDPREGNEWDGGILAAIALAIENHFNEGLEILVDEQDVPIGKRANQAHLHFHDGDEGLEYANQVFGRVYSALSFADFSIVDLPDEVTNLMFMFPMGLKGIYPATIVKSYTIGGDHALRIYWGEKCDPLLLRLECMFQPVHTEEYWPTPEEETTVPETTPPPTETTPPPTETTPPPPESKDPTAGPQGQDPTHPEIQGTHDPSEQSTEDTPEPTAPSEEYVPPTAPPPEEVEETTTAAPPSTTAAPESTTAAPESTTAAPPEETTTTAEVVTGSPESSYEDVVQSLIDDSESEYTPEPGLDPTDGGGNGECLPPE